MNPLDYYKILIAYCAEDPLGEGIRKCQVFVRNIDSLTDNLLVEFLNGKRRWVNGIYLFSTKALALEYVESLKQNALLVLNTSLKEIQKEISTTIDMYSNIRIEDGEFRI